MPPVGICVHGELFPKALAIEYIVAQDKGNIVLTNEFFTYNKCLGEAIWFGLLSIVKGDPPFRTITQQPFELRQIIGRGNNKNFADTSQQKVESG